MKRATIREVRAYVQGPGAAGADYHAHPTRHWIVDTMIANPMSVYERYKASRTSWGIDALGSVIVEVELDDGTIETLDEVPPDQRYPKEATSRHLVDLLLGRDENRSSGELGARVVELLDAAYRSATERRIVRVDEL